MWLNVTGKEFLKICQTLNKEDGASKKLAHELLLRREEQKRLAKYRKAAEKQQKDGEIEIDRDAVVSKGADPGAYVMAWIWIYDEECKSTTPD